MMNYNTSKRFKVLFFIAFLITMLLIPNSFSRSVSSVPFTNGIIIPHSYSETTRNGGNTDQSVNMMPTQNITSTAYNKATVPVQGFSNIVCSNGYGYVLMTGQYTAGNTSYKVIFLRMTLLDNNGHVLATGTGHVENVNAHNTTTFNAITRYPSAFSSCTIQIDSAIPK
jgi:hypothetical protein